MAATDQIRVDPAVKARLAEMREGWETPNETLRRILGLDAVESEEKEGAVA